jgi:hypothetical protein
MTRDAELQDEIDKLSALTGPSAAERLRLKEVEAELERINKKKEDYVAEHPEQRKLVYRARRTDQDSGEAGSSKPVDRTRKLFGKNGLPLHPERSIYYDPILNPFGVPPPGMPYIERRTSLIVARVFQPELRFPTVLRPDEIEAEEGSLQSNPALCRPQFESRRFGR